MEFRHDYFRTSSIQFRESSEKDVEIFIHFFCKFTDFAFRISASLHSLRELSVKVHNPYEIADCNPLDHCYCNDSWLVLISALKGARPHEHPHSVLHVACCCTTRIYYFCVILFTFLLYVPTAIKTRTHYIYGPRWKLWEAKTIPTLVLHFPLYIGVSILGVDEVIVITKNFAKWIVAMRPNDGLVRDLNPGPLAPEARIIPHRLTSLLQSCQCTEQTYCMYTWENQNIAL